MSLVQYLQDEFLEENDSIPYFNLKAVARKGMDNDTNWSSFPMFRRIAGTGVKLGGDASSKVWESTRIKYNLLKIVPNNELT